jgi:hypothetical protein
MPPEPADRTVGTPDDLLLGRVAFEKGLIDGAQLEEALRRQVQARARGEEAFLGEILVRGGWVKADELPRLLAEQRRRAEGIPDLSRYAIRERLGEGATAVVYRAWDRQLGRAVALKLLRETVDPHARERFRREAQAAAGLAHPNVVAVHDAGEAEGRLYLVLELVEGRPLGELLREVRPLAETVRLLEKASLGVAAAHAKGVVHRDLKPQNILVSTAGEPKVGDFGLAHLEGSGSELTKTGTTLGTPLYMSPEQVEGRTKDLSARTDVYALGAILYEILTGRPPHAGETTMEIYGKIVREEPAPPRGLNPKAPRDLETVCRKALEKDPARRYADAGGFAEELRRHREGEPILARPPGPLVRAFGWTRRHRRAAALGAAALVVLAAAATGLAVRRIAASRALARHLDLGRRAATREEVLGHYREALLLDPSNVEAKRALAATYCEAFEAAERAGERGAVELNFELARFFDDGTLAPRLVKRGRLTVRTHPPGAEILSGGRLLGVSPIEDVLVPAGLVALRARKPPYPEAAQEVPVEWGTRQEVGFNLYRVGEAAMAAVFEEAKTPHKRVILRGEPGTNLDAPAVFRHGGRWLMLYVAERGTVHETMLAECSDLVVWTPRGRALGPSGEGWDRTVAVGTPSLQDPSWEGPHGLATHEGKYWMSYFGAREHRSEKGTGIGMAWTRDPSNPGGWTRLAENPVLHPGQPGAARWENRSLLKNFVMRDPEERLGFPFLMYYEGEEETGVRRIGLAVSRDLVRWERRGEALFNHGGGLSGRPQVVRIGDLWTMFYFGAFWKPDGFDTFACSYDLAHWTTAREDQFLLRPTESWDRKFAHKPWMLKHEGVVYHFYCAEGSQGRVIALATSRPLR